MQFIKTGQQIAVENFNIGAIYKVVFADSTEKYMMCVGIGKDFVMLFADTLFALKMKSASKVNTIDLYDPTPPTPPIPSTNLLQYQTGLPPFDFFSSGGYMWSTQIQGNTVQNGTPSPSNPVDVVGVGELETSGDKAGQYKIPILNGSVTTDVYLGEVQTVRNLKKRILTGEETYNRINNDYTSISGTIAARNWTYTISTCGGIISSNNGSRLWILNSAFPNYTTAEAMQEYFAQQYASGNPVEVWYVLASPETGIVNEPLMRLTTSSNVYSDSLEFFGKISISSGNNTVTVGTSIQPSDMTIAYPIEVES